MRGYSHTCHPTPVTQHTSHTWQRALAVGLLTVTYTMYFFAFLRLYLSCETKVTCRSPSITLGTCCTHRTPTPVLIPRGKSHLPIINYHTHQPRQCRTLLRLHTYHTRHTSPSLTCENSVLASNVALLLHNTSMISLPD